MPDERCEVPSGDRVSGKRFRDTIVGEGASELKFPGDSVRDLLFDLLV